MSVIACLQQLRRANVPTAFVALSRSSTEHAIFLEIVWSRRICQPLVPGVTFVSTGERPAKHENAQDVPVRCVFPGI